MKEIERKWKLTKSQATEFINRNWPEKCYNIYQGYFYCDDPNREFRVRLMTNKDNPTDDKAYLTIKDKIYAKERKELEISIGKESALLLLNECENFLEKNRYICSDGLYLFQSYLNQMIQSYLYQMLTNLDYLLHYIDMQQITKN